MPKETENRSLIIRGGYDLTMTQRSLIERGIMLAESLGPKLYICPILGAKFVLIRAGTFMMGSPEDEVGRYNSHHMGWTDDEEEYNDDVDDETLHQVTISKSFYLQTTPVTQGQWKTVMHANPSANDEGDDNLPVENVSWEDVQRFILKLSEMEGTNQYCLPTEAEWEYACRAGSTTAYCFGDEAYQIDDYAWYGDNAGYDTCPVGQKKPNKWGLYDMHGNVWEWCHDLYGDYQLEKTTDPTGSSKGSCRVCRGGSCFGDVTYCRSASRDYFSQDVRIYSIGFRLVRIVDDILRETVRDGDFIFFNNGTVLDTRTNLMWATKSSEDSFNWHDAKRYCENYRRGGYSDWRLPTTTELEELHYNTADYEIGSEISEVWASETSGSKAAIFIVGHLGWAPQSMDDIFGALPVRSAK